MLIFTIFQYTFCISIQTKINDLKKLLIKIKLLNISKMKIFFWNDFIEFTINTCPSFIILVESIEESRELVYDVVNTHVVYMSIFTLKPWSLNISILIVFGKKFLWSIGINVSIFTIFPLHQPFNALFKFLIKTWN